MTSAQLKTALHESIENINDIQLLRTLSEISKHHYSALQEPELNDYQLSRLHESEKQIEVKNYFTNEQANELIQQWLKK